MNGVSFSTNCLEDTQHQHIFLHELQKWWRYLMQNSRIHSIINSCTQFAKHFSPNSSPTQMKGEGKGYVDLSGFRSWFSSPMRFHCVSGSVGWARAMLGGRWLEWSSGTRNRAALVYVCDPTGPIRIPKEVWTHVYLTGNPCNAC